LELQNHSKNQSHKSIMKNKNSVKFFALLLSVLYISISSCKKDKVEETVTANGSLMLHIHTMADTTEIEALGDTIFLSDGRMLVADAAQLYISNVKLIKTDGTVVDGPSVILLQKQGTEEYEIGSVPAGNYKSIRFDVGLSNSVNSSSPSSSDAVLYQPSMWFGANAQPDGFVFVNFSGSIDTSLAMDGSGFAPFAYKIGTTPNRVTITMPDENFTVSPGMEAMVHMSVDYAKLLAGLDITNASNLSVATPADNGGSPATEIVANISDLFEYE
jgi:hypothetical protein